MVRSRSGLDWGNTDAVPLSMTDVRQRLQALWIRRGELDARLRLWLWRSALATRGARQGLQALWLRGRELRATWALPSILPVATGGSASKATRIAALSAAVIIAAAVAALVTGIPVPFLANALAKRFESETGYRLLIAGHAKIRLLPSPVVTAGDISVVDGKDGERPDAVHGRRHPHQDVAVEPDLAPSPLDRGRDRQPDIPDSAAARTNGTGLEPIGNGQVRRRGAAAGPHRRPFDRRRRHGAVRQPAGSRREPHRPYRAHRVAFGGPCACGQGIRHSGRAGLARRVERQAAGGAG